MTRYNCNDDYDYKKGEPRQPPKKKNREMFSCDPDFPGYIRLCNAAIMLGMSTKQVRRLLRKHPEMGRRVRKIGQRTVLLPVDLLNKLDFYRRKKKPVK